MKSQEKGWLENMLGWGQKRQLETCEILYGNAVEMARSPLSSVITALPTRSTAGLTRLPWSWR